MCPPTPQLRFNGRLWHRKVADDNNEYERDPKETRNPPGIRLGLRGGRNRVWNENRIWSRGEEEAREPVVALGPVWERAPTWEAESVLERGWVLAS
jgi:hypothetical protein